jgi:hypothetical protein
MNANSGWQISEGLKIEKDEHNAYHITITNGSSE